MNTQLAELIDEYHKEESFYDTASIFEYSGRNMNGNTTDAVKVNDLHHFHTLLAGIIEDAADNEDSETLFLLAEGLRKVRFDKLGHEMVVY